MSESTDAITKQLRRYEAALNASRTEDVLPLYAADGIFMAPNVPSAVGTAALRQAYDGVFHTIRLSVQFRIDEVVVAGPDWAFARTASRGKVRVLASGTESDEANQELFVFQRMGADDWRIARYAFSSILPLRTPPEVA